MTTTTKSLLESALALPEEERMAMAEALWESLPDEAFICDDEAFADELRRRSEEMKNDPSASIPWEEVRKKIWRT